MDLQGLISEEEFRNAPLDGEYNKYLYGAIEYKPDNLFYRIFPKKKKITDNFSYAIIIGNKFGYTTKFKEDLSVNACMNPLSKYIHYKLLHHQTMFHELAHVAHNDFEEIELMPSSVREVIAEFCSYAICKKYNLVSDSKACVLYIKNWAYGDINRAKRIIEEYTDDILKIINSIIAVIEQENIRFDVAA